MTAAPPEPNTGSHPEYGHLLARIGESVRRHWILAVVLVAEEEPEDTPPTSPTAAPAVEKSSLSAAQRLSSGQLLLSRGAEQRYFKNPS
jgi:hypothetical protein